MTDRELEIERARFLGTMLAESGVISREIAERFAERQWPGDDELQSEFAKAVIEVLRQRQG